MRRLKLELCLAAIVSLIIYGIVSILEGKFSSLGLASSIFAFLATLAIDILLQLKEISSHLHLQGSVADIEHPFLRKYAGKLIQKNLEIFQELEQQVIRFDSESSMMHVYYDVFSNEPGGSILATSMVSLDHVWGTARGERALEENANASARGVSIQRIFIFPNEEKRDEPGSQKYLRRQKQEARVDVWHVLASELSPNLRKDFLVTDSNVVLEYRIDSEGNIVECILCCSGKAAEKYRDLHRQILEASTQFQVSGES